MDGSIREVSLKYLTSRARSGEEVRKHLLEKNFPREDVLEELKDLAEFGYIDDADLAERTLETGLSKGKGLPGILMELRRRGVCQEDIEEGLAALEIDSVRETERNRALEEATKLAAGEAVTDKLLAKIGRRLLSKGFDSEAVYGAVGKLMRMKEKEER